MTAADRSRPSGGRERVAGKLEQVVGSGDQAPFRSDGGSASWLEACDPAVVFGLAEHGLDHRLALLVKPAAALSRQHAAHERVKAAIPTRSGAPALARIRGDHPPDPPIDDPLHLLLVPVAGICQ